VQFSAFTTGLVALVLCVSAYNAETFRAGINSVRHGQTNAGLALGMSQFQVMKEIILPQAARRVLPTPCNHLGLFVQGYVSGFGDCRGRVIACGLADSFTKLSGSGNADGNGCHLLDDGLSASQIV